MPKSVNFIRIKGDVLGIVADLPPGRVTTYPAIGGHLDVMARDVGYILAALTDDERVGMPWHRVVADGGRASRTNPARYAEQVRLLAEEGVAVSAKGMVDDFAAVFRPIG